jgi:hypothetical protein
MVKAGEPEYSRIENTQVTENRNAKTARNGKFAFKLERIWSATFSGRSQISRARSSFSGYCSSFSTDLGRSFYPVCAQPFPVRTQTHEGR